MSEDEISELDVEHKITNYLGNPNFDKYRFHYFNSEIGKGDKVLIMSDGVSDFVNDNELSILMKKNKSIENCALLIKGIVENKGALDNYSLIILEA